MDVVRGLVLTFLAFAVSFALHIVGGATDQGWLFAIAVALIFLTATGFPAIALILARLESWEPRGRVTLGLGFVIGVALTGGALWAANDRAWAAWQVGAAPGLVIGVSLLLLVLRRLPAGGRLLRGPLARER